MYCSVLQERDDTCVPVTLTMRYSVAAVFYTVCCSLLECVAGSCSVMKERDYECLLVISFIMYCAAVCCSVLQCIAVCCSVLQCVAVYCSVFCCTRGNTDGGDEISNNYDCQSFQQVSTGVPVHIMHVFSGVPKISNRVSLE